MQQFSKEFEKAWALIQRHDRILIISHRNPDADTIGSNLALKLALAQFLGKHVTSACIDILHPSLHFLPFSDSIQITFDLNKIDLIIIVDCGGIEQVKFHHEVKDLFSGKIPIINIDHHDSNNNYGIINIVASEVASTAEIIFHFLEFAQIRPTPAIATCLLAGIYGDTGSFMHPNTTPSTYKIAGKLLQYGAMVQPIIKNMFKTNKVEQLKLWGRVLSNARINSNGAMVSRVTKTDFEETNSSPEDLSGIINYLNSVPGISFSILLSEDLEGNVKGSFRTLHDDINVADFSKQLGGGGHQKAARIVTLPSF